MISLLRASLKIAITSLLVSKVQSFLTMLGIIIGVSSVIILVSIGSGLQEFISQQFEGLGTNLLIVLPGKIDVKTGRGRVPGTNLPASLFTLDDVRRLSRGSPYIKNVVPILNNSARVKIGPKETLTTVTGTSASYPQVRNLVMAGGSFFSVPDADSSRKVVVVGATVANNLFGEGSVVPLGSVLSISGDYYTIIGSAMKRGASVGGADQDDQVFIPITAAQQKFGAPNPGLLVVEAVSKEQIDLAIAGAQRILGQRLREDDFTVLNQGELLSTVSSILNVVTIALGGIAAISLVVGGIGIMNIMLVTVAERTREIGLRKAVGASFTDILWQFLIEATVVASLGGVVGILLGFLGAFIIGKFISTEVTPWSVLLAFSFSALVGIIFGILPAYKAAKLDPIEALRYE